MLEGVYAYYALYSPSKRPTHQLLHCLEELTFFWICVIMNNARPLGVRNPTERCDIEQTLSMNLLTFIIYARQTFLQLIFLFLWPLVY